MAPLQIYDRRERALVAAADALIAPAARVSRAISRRSRPERPRRLLLLRLERIGDLLMAVPAFGDLRAALPDAEIHLAVGSWNRALAEQITAVDRVHTVDAPWLARGARGVSASGLVRQALSWRAPRYDVALNFEPDVRSNVLLALTGARWLVGYRSAGGGPLLDVALDYCPTEHTTDNARRLVASALGAPASKDAPLLLRLTEEHRNQAERLLAPPHRPLVAMHVAGGREVKQWPVERFAAVAKELVARRSASIVLTGSSADRPMVHAVRAQLPPAHVIDVSGTADLMTLAAILERSDLMITGDTGPMHLAAAVGTPIVAIFGPSDPRRYAPRGPRDHIVRVELPCAPCNRIRLPPARCTGHSPDCLTFIDTERVLHAALASLDRSRDVAPQGTFG